MKHCITIGTFDGIHLGHRFLFTQLETLAARLRMRPQILYFPLPPKTLLSSTPEMTVLTTPAEKRLLLTALGTPATPLNFAECEQLTPQQFFEVLVSNYKMGALVVGADFAFGKDRQGSVDFLRQACAQADIPFEVIHFYKTGTEKISSSLIRKILASGDTPRVQTLLGRPYELTGTVIQGQQLGRKLGFPTANLDTGIYKILPLGVFAVRVRVGNAMYNGFCNIGFRPTVNPIDDKLPLVEVHIFNFDKDIYGHEITVYFAEKIRDEQKFDGLNALVNQLKADKAYATNLLAAYRWN